MFNWLLTHTPLLYLTQSLWRDEAFSVFTAEKPILSFIGTLNFEPPFYYVLLHLWVKVFGESEIAVRSLSLVGFALATCVVIVWAEKIFKTHWLSWFIPIVFFLNPMLLYYGFEVRAYGWMMFFSTLSLYAYTQKKYRLMTLANILAFYTHSYAIIIPFVQFVHYVFSHQKFRDLFTIKFMVNDRFFRSLFTTGIVIAPWFIPIYEEAKKMRPTWYYPVDLQLVKSVLGNMFTGYDGTPGGMWGYTAILSLIILAMFYIVARSKKDRRETSFLLAIVFLPLVLIVGISFKKPLFVNRYLIYVTISQIILIGYFLRSIKNPLFQKLSALVLLLFVLWLNTYLPSKKAKLDIRTVVAEANALRTKTDVLYVTDPLIFFETVYYTPDRESVFLYNPNHNPFPWYVGEAAFSPSQMADQLPEHPKRAIIISPDKSITISYRILKSTVLGVTATER